MKVKISATMLFCLLTATVFAESINWIHLSSKNGDLEPPNVGKEQTSSLVFDIDKQAQTFESSSLPLTSLVIDRHFGRIMFSSLASLG